jgi:AcrR family transcriptional regulator
MSHDSDGRTRILNSASILFAERGFRGVSISDVADAAGLVKSSIYHHFANKRSTSRC